MMNRKAVKEDILGGVIEFVKEENNTARAMGNRLRMVEAKSVDIKEDVDNNESLCKDLENWLSSVEAMLVSLEGTAAD
ncbi:hypothetical protein SK128_018263, partial [Halocaridina rubra]